MQRVVPGVQADPPRLQVHATWAALYEGELDFNGAAEARAQAGQHRGQHSQLRPGSGHGPVYG